MDVHGFKALGSDCVLRRNSIIISFLAHKLEWKDISIFRSVSFQ